MELVLEMRAKTKGLRYAQYMLKVYGKFMLYHLFAVPVWGKLRHFPRQNLRALEGFVIISRRCREGMDQYAISTTDYCNSEGE